MFLYCFPQSNVLRLINITSTAPAYYLLITLRVSTFITALHDPKRFSITLLALVSHRYSFPSTSNEFFFSSQVVVSGYLLLILSLVVPACIKPIVTKPDNFFAFMFLSIPLSVPLCFFKANWAAYKELVEETLAKKHDFTISKKIPIIFGIITIFIQVQFFKCLFC